MGSLKVAWEGCIPAVVTPFDKDGGINEGAYKRNILKFLDDGVSGILPTGHNGEEWAVTIEEKANLWSWAKETVASAGSKVPVIAGIDAVSTRDLIEEAKVAQESGADGVMITPPFYLAAASESEIWARYEGVARAVGIPIIVYNNPRRTVINLEPAFIARLADIDAVVGVKQSNKDFLQIQETVRLVGGKAKVFVGPAALILPGVIVGAAGYISTGPDMLGKEGVEYYHIIKRGDMKRALEIHWKLTQIYSMLNKYGTWPASLKVALSLTGKEGGYPRDPIQPLTAEQTEAVKKVLAGVGALREAAAD